MSIVVLPPPDEIETAVERSHYDVNDDEMTQMLSKWEPFSPSKLLDKTHSLRAEALGVSSFHKIQGSPNNEKNTPKKGK